LLCAAGATLGILISRPMLSVLAPYISRYSIRATEIAVDSSLLWVGAGLAVLAAVLLAFVPRLPTSSAVQRFAVSIGSARVTPAANRKLRIFAVVQIAASFVLVSVAGVTVKTLVALKAAQTGFDTHHVLALIVPVLHNGKTPQQIVDYYREAGRKIRGLPGVENVPWATPIPGAAATTMPPQSSCRPTNALRCRAKTHMPRMRIISPGFFATLGLPLIEGRDFTEADRSGSERVAILSLSLAQKLFPTSDALNHHMRWTDPIIEAVPLISGEPMRVIGIVPDIDDVNLAPKPALTVYRPFDQEAALGGGELFVHARSNPYALVNPIRQILHGMSAEQPVEHPATLDVRAEVLSPERLDAIVFGAFAGVALLIAVVGGRRRAGILGERTHA